MTTIAGNNFILRTDDGDVLLQAGQVRSLTIKEMKTTLPRTVTTQQADQAADVRVRQARSRSTPST